MGKSQFPNHTAPSSSAMDVDSQPSAWSALCPQFPPSFLDACHDKGHLQESVRGQLIGSPPPKGPRCWEAPDELHSNLRLEVPRFNPQSGDCANNNYRGGSAPNSFSIGSKIGSEITNSGSECNGHVMVADSSDAAELSTRVQELRLQQQPIIVYEDVGDANDGDSAIDQCDEDEILTLTVPTVDVTEEKKRPPLASLVSY